MKINIQRKKFLNLIGSLTSIIPTSSTLPILENVKLDFKDNKLFATGDNLAIRCINSVDLVGFDNLSVCVNAPMLLSVLKTSVGDEINLHFTNNKLTIKHKKGVFNLPTIPSNEYPEIKKEEFDSKAKVNSEAFKNSLKVANKFISNEDVDAMSNIHIQLGKEIYVYSTDRARLFKELIKGSSDDGSILLNGKTSLSLFSLIDVNDELELHYNESKMYLKFGSKEVFITQQSGKFPSAQFDRILDTIEESKSLKLNMNSFIDALKRVSVLSSKDPSSSVKLVIEKNNINLSCENVDFANSASESFSCKSKIDKTVGYNYKYLIEILSVFEDDAELFLQKKSNLLFIKQKKKIGALAPILLT